MTHSNASTDDESDAEIDSPRFDDWVQPATNWEASDRSATTDPEEWVYAIDQLPPDIEEPTAGTVREQHQQSAEQPNGNDHSDSTEGDN
ncbi:hypothetical protein [Halalkalicoccus subterraneus]|jgi:hypothetical protein|uniref:hypothetical protein n=1 Tax=Halalkalicoccus subterraneus TaxID=2675002 RepID=UPI0013CEE337|nr:hypothetical protein [Halalkalicoccus subterraneus]